METTDTQRHTHTLQHSEGKNWNVQCQEYFVIQPCWLDSLFPENKTILGSLEEIQVLASDSLADSGLSGVASDYFKSQLGWHAMKYHLCLNKRASPFFHIALCEQ